MKRTAKNTMSSKVPKKYANMKILEVKRYTPVEVSTVPDEDLDFSESPVREQPPSPPSSPCRADILSYFNSCSRSSTASSPTRSIPANSPAKRGQKRSPARPDQERSPARASQPRLSISPDVATSSSDSSSTQAPSPPTPIYKSDVSTMTDETDVVSQMEGLKNELLKSLQESQTSLNKHIEKLMTNQDVYTQTFKRTLDSTDKISSMMMQLKD